MIALYNNRIGAYGGQNMSNYDPEYQQTYRQENAARIKEVNRQRKLRDPEKYKAQKRADYEKHMDAYKARAKVHREANAERIKARRSTLEYKTQRNEWRRAQYVAHPLPPPMTRAQKLAKKREDYAKDREVGKLYRKRHYQANKEQWKHGWQKKQYWLQKFRHGIDKATQKGAYIEPGDGLKLFYKQLFTQITVACDYCHEVMPVKSITVDHKEPYVLGGKHVVANLAVSCLACNLRKGEMPYSKWTA